MPAAIIRGFGPRNKFVVKSSKVQCSLMNSAGNARPVSLSILYVYLTSQGCSKLRPCVTANMIRAEEFNNHIYEICLMPEGNTLNIDQTIFKNLHSPHSLHGLHFTSRMVSKMKPRHIGAVRDRFISWSS